MTCSSRIICLKSEYKTYFSVTCLKVCNNSCFILPIVLKITLGFVKYVNVSYVYEGAGKVSAHHPN